MSEWRNIWVNGFPSVGRLRKSGHRMAVKRMQFLQRLNGDTISLNLGVVSEMSAKVVGQGVAKDPVRPGECCHA